MKNELLAGKISRINDEELGSCVGGAWMELLIF